MGGTYLDYPMMCSGRVTEMREAKMDEKVKEIEEWRSLYPEICETDGLWQTAPKPFYSDEMLVAIRYIDYLLSHIKQLKELTNNMGSDKVLSEVLYEYHERADRAEARIKELEDEKDDLAGICASAIRKRKELEEGIEGILHGNNLISYAIEKRLRELIGKEKP